MKLMLRRPPTSSSQRHLSKVMKPSRPNAKARERERIQLESNVLSRIQRLKPAQLPRPPSQRSHPPSRSAPSQDINVSDVFYQQSSQVPLSTSSGHPISRSYGLTQIRAYTTPQAPPIDIEGIIV
jgi:hypothetical protein